MPMKLNFGKSVLKINVSFAVAVTLTLIIDESGVGAIALLCCIIHEAGHIICLLILGEKPRKIELSFYGIKLERFPMAGQSTAGDLAVYISGSVANLIFSALIFALSSFTDSLRFAATISLCIGLFNMIPCKPLDGGNILFTLLCRNVRRKIAGKICFVVTIIMLIPMVAAGIYLLTENGNITLLAVSVYLAAAVFFEHKTKTVLEI